MSVRVLIISRNAWNNTNNSGNTLSNIFQNFSSNELAQIYCRDEIPENVVCKKFFKISEALILKRILSKKKVKVGYEVDINEASGNTEALYLEVKEKKRYDFFRNHRWVVLLWLRELLWATGIWKSKELKNFIEGFNPSVIYTEAYDSFYMYNILNYVLSIKSVPLVLFHCDDLATFKQLSFSPFYWFNRIILRIKLKSATKKAGINYCIIDKQKNVYQNIFKKEFKLLYKCSDFSSERVFKEIGRGPIQIVYTGNIIYSRWKILSVVAKAINRINKDGQKFVLKIYTANRLSKKIYKALNYPESVQLMGAVPYSEIPQVLNDADILLFVESFNLRQKLITSLSFSTKILDYFKAGRCILAIGWEQSSSIKYLEDNDAAITIKQGKNIFSTLEKLVSNKGLINQYAKNAFECGRRNHDKRNILKSFRDDIVELSSNCQQCDGRV